MASYYPDELINEVISANNLVDVVSGYVKLKKSGNRYMGLCPFHSEKTPSFHVSADKQLYHCFGCNEGGSVVQFIMKTENLDFVEAIKYLASRVGISLPEGNEKSSDGEYFQKKQKILEMYVDTARFYHGCLIGDIGKTALSYLAQRQIDAQTITRFGIGYSPDSYDALFTHLKEKGYSDKLIMESGLVRKSEKTGKPYDFFRDRVMIPIFDIRGNVIAFGGRTMVKSDGRKYMNSSDSIIFNKSKTLYALNFAKKNCSERIIMVEGYMDVITLHKYGFTNAVAGLGTAFTKDHANLLARYTKEVVLCYDSDEAGRKAVMSAIEILTTTQLKVKVMTIPDAKDADEYLKLKGAVKFRKLLDNAQSHILYKISRLKEQYNMDNTEEKITLVTNMAKIFSEVTNSIEREAYVKEASIETGISEDVIYAEIKKAGYSAPSAKIKPTYTQRVKSISEGDFRTEGTLLSLMCSDIAIWRRVRNKITADFFECPVLKEIVNNIFSFSPEDKPPDLIMIISKSDNEAVSRLSSLITNQQTVDDGIKAAEEMIEKLSKAKKARQISDIANSGDPRALAQMIKNLNK
ncbi:MAG: DNA primase [Clostridia bacterium]|nr:DNA primase [Clostridia bacterium]